MALNLMCSNSKCVHYFEEGICEGYKFIERSEVG